MQLVEDLRVPTQELLDENDWIDEETKRLVMEKTDAMVVLAGFPEWNSNVSALDQYYDKVASSFPFLGNDHSCSSIKNRVQILWAVTSSCTTRTK